MCAVQSSPVPGVTVIEAYIYDADGQRVEKGQVSTFSCNMATNGYKAEHAYALGQSGEQITEVDGSGHWLHTNVYAAGKLFASYDQNGNSLNFQLTDWVGTRRVQTNYAGAPEASFQSLPFGSRLISIPATDCTPDQDCYPADMTGTPLHFTGKERDTESGLDYFGARYYSSMSGRFISPDWSAKEEAVPYAKLNNPQTLNLYAYVGNNPLTSIDIDGHRSLAAGSPQGCAGNGSVGCSPSEQEDQDLARKAQEQAQQQSSASSTDGGGFWSHVGNLFHGHSWDYVQTSVTTTETYAVGEPDAVVTAATDAVSVGALAAPKVAENIPLLGWFIAGISIANDPSHQNIESNVTGLIAPTSAPTLAFIDLFDYGVNHSSPGPQKVYGNDQLQPVTIPTQNGGECAAAGADCQ